jgi:hypothetical protein
VRSADFQAEVIAHDGWLPQPWHGGIECGAGRQVTVTVWIRCGRAGWSGPAGWRLRLGQQRATWWDGKRPLYVGVTVRHNGRRAWRPSDGPLPCSVRAHRVLRDLRDGSAGRVIGKVTSLVRNVTSRSGDVTVPSPADGGLTVKAGMSHIFSKLRNYLHGNPGSSAEGER